MEKKFSIFVSSTYEDLKKERKAIHDAILKMGHFPVGMEYFPASNTKQWGIIERLINEADYYVLIIGRRYGSVDSSTGRSYTQKEFEFALSLNKPILVFVKKLSDSEKSRIDNEERLAKFTNEALSQRTGCFWDNITTLLVDVITSLYSEFENHPQLGWVKDIASQKREATNKIEKKENLQSSTKKDTLAWEQLMRFASFDDDELNVVYHDVIIEMKEKNYGSTVPLACISYVFAYLKDRVQRVIPNEDENLLIENYRCTLSRYKFREDLYDSKLSFSKTIQYQPEYHDLETLTQYCERFRHVFAKEWSLKPDKMTYALQHITDDNIGQLSAIEQNTLPDHSTSFVWTSIFDKVNIDTLFNAIVLLANKGRLQFAMFISNRYNLCFALSESMNKDGAFSDDKKPLEDLNKKLNEELDKNSGLVAHSYKVLIKNIKLAIERINGETNRLIDL